MRGLPSGCAACVACVARLRENPVRVRVRVQVCPGARARVCACALWDLAWCLPVLCDAGGAYVCPRVGPAWCRPDLARSERQRVVAAWAGVGTTLGFRSRVRHPSAALSACRCEPWPPGPAHRPLTGGARSPRVGFAAGPGRKRVRVGGAASVMWGDPWAWRGPASGRCRPGEPRTRTHTGTQARTYVHTSARPVPSCPVPAGPGREPRVVEALVRIFAWCKPRFRSWRVGVGSGRLGPWSGGGRRPFRGEPRRVCRTGPRVGARAVGGGPPRPGRE